jgi:hypothetical protein
MLKDHAEGKPLPGLDPRSYRVRSTRYEAPKDLPFLETLKDRMRVAPAEAV